MTKPYTNIVTTSDLTDLKWSAPSYKILLYWTWVIVKTTGIEPMCFHIVKLSTLNPISTLRWLTLLSVSLQGHHIFSLGLHQCNIVPHKRASITSRFFLGVIFLPATLAFKRKGLCAGQERISLYVVFATVIGLLSRKIMRPSCMVSFKAGTSLKMYAMWARWSRLDSNQQIHQSDAPSL